VHFQGLIEQFDEREKIRGDQFERVCRWYLLNSPTANGMN
jgi:hypothetical protein